MSNNKTKISESQNKKLETFAIVFLILFALISSFVTKVLSKKENKSICVFINGNQVTNIDGVTISLDNPGTYTIGDEKGEYNVVEIKDHQIKCIDANCPDKICVSHGYLNKDIDNDMIVCAPHGLVIRYN